MRAARCIAAPLGRSHGLAGVTAATLVARRFLCRTSIRRSGDKTPPPLSGPDATASASPASPASADSTGASVREGATMSTTCGTSFAASQSQRGAPGRADETPERSRLYTHTILTEADKPPTGVATPAAGATAAAAAASPVPTAAGAGGPRKRYTTVPLRSSTGARAEPGSGVGGLPPSSRQSGAVAVQWEAAATAVKTAARPQDGPMVPDHGPLRATGLWSVEEVVDASKRTVDFRRIDEVESELAESLKDTEEALVPYAEEEAWKHKLMFECKFKKTPKHLTWKELGEEIECMDCVIELDEHRPEELFTILFYFTDKRTGTRDVVWSARNDVSYSEGFTDLLAAVGACLGRSDVHRTIRFDDGVGRTRDLTFRKRSRYTSDVYVAFRPAETYNKFQRKEEEDEYATAMEKEGMSTWGYHPSLMDPEFSELDFTDPEGTYEVAISAHGFSFIVLRAVHRLLARPMKDFYRPSQLMRTAKVRTEDEVGFTHALKGWLGVDEQIYPHYTPIEALQDHWLGKDAPFTLCAIVNKLREMNYLKKENPEFQSWLSVRHRDTHLAIRNMGVKLLGVGASTLFVPVAHNPTVNRLLPKQQQRRLESRFSLNAVLGLPDETRRLEEFKQITGHHGITGVPTSPTPDASPAEVTPPPPRSTDAALPTTRTPLQPPPAAKNEEHGRSARE
ncbi:hypothetical protein NESM_000021600 [Novymonas esmeraldas]|uniref:Uncharacterized protein n=1 Tax=Novymonas esmeraldas TaxID=1808958 RepID=A0AAW0F3E1_9TRYP